MYVQVRMREEEPLRYRRPDEARRLARASGREELLTARAGQTFDPEESPRLPVYVELRSFVDSGKERLPDLAAKDLLDRYAFRDAVPYLEARLAAGEAATIPRRSHGTRMRGVPTRQAAARSRSPWKRPPPARPRAAPSPAPGRPAARATRRPSARPAA
ncbi:hypothetical protein FXF51_23435 [Nonomuraea sp. PA05]|uniref:hypothetical protein n=1 Tax=Nonomuraea sp. PA05 TaxID=2604466 RepID=UPI0011D887FD|nr:hypothetical protein [Nonomuraea sp. PA05]TYB64002.1 hypothetical protein FXF51_23435 [Nonomuraea sp. PA05]